MKKISSLVLSTSLLFTVFSFAVLPVFVSAADQGSQPDQGGQAPGGGTPTRATATLTNPLKYDSLSRLFTEIAQLAVNISYVIIAFFLLLSGFKFVKAQGAPTELEDAKRTFYYTIIGAVIIVGAQTIILVVQSIIRSLQAP